jgi:hypothetical protein
MGVPIPPGMLAVMKYFIIHVKYYNLLSFLFIQYFYYNTIIFLLFILEPKCILMCFEILFCRLTNMIPKRLLIIK